jgi:hypothetical protein
MKVSDPCQPPAGTSCRSGIQDPPWHRCRRLAQGGPGRCPRTATRQAPQRADRSPPLVHRAQWAGSGVPVLLRVYATCQVDSETTALRRADGAGAGASGRPPCVRILTERSASPGGPLNVIKDSAGFQAH